VSYQFPSTDNYLELAVQFIVQVIRLLSSNGFSLPSKDFSKNRLIILPASYDSVAFVELSYADRLLSSTSPIFILDL